MKVKFLYKTQKEKLLRQKANHTNNIIFKKL